MRAEDHFQNLKHGINLLNLLMLYTAPANEAVVAALDALLDEGRLRLAVADLELLEKRLRDLPETAGTEVTASDYHELEGGPLRDLLRRLALVNSLYLGKNGQGATAWVQQQLNECPFADLHTLQLALVSLHQLKAAV